MQATLAKSILAAASTRAYSTSTAQHIDAIGQGTQSSAMLEENLAWLTLLNR
jgi:hypothetical protein